MNSDAFFKIGTTHRVCQDYAVAHDNFVLLADGCSSSPDTDIGARLLVKSAEKTYLELHDTMQNDHNIIIRSNYFHKDTIENSTKDAMKIFSIGTWNIFETLQKECFDATLLGAYANDKIFVAFCYGDGVMVARHKSGEYRLITVEFSGNYPKYPSYSISQSRTKSFNAQQANDKIVTTYKINKGQIHKTESVSENTVEILSGKSSDYDFVAVLSDGVHSFLELEKTATSKSTRIVLMTEFLETLFSFKTYSGEFVQRRMKKFFETTCAEKNWFNTDDFSVAAIHLGGLD